MKLTDRRLKIPPPLTITPAMAEVMRELVQFNDPFVEALAQKIRERAVDSPHLLRQPPKRTPGRRA